MLNTGTFNLYLRAVQTDNQAQEDQAVLQITVTGETDNAPFFHKPKHETIVSESEKVGSVIMTITAVDLDQVCNLILFLAWLHSSVEERILLYPGVHI